MSARRPLDVIEVHTPCPADWEQMSGDSARRFCTHCRKFVHNLSAMPSDEAERLVCENSGNLCVRSARNPNTGAVMTLDYAPAPRSTRRRAILTIASILGSLGFAGAWTAAKLLREPPAVQGGIMVMGEPLPPPPPGNGSGIATDDTGGEVLPAGDGPINPPADPSPQM